MAHYEYPMHPYLHRQEVAAIRVGLMLLWHDLVYHRLDMGMAQDLDELSDGIPLTPGEIDGLAERLGIEWMEAQGEIEPEDHRGRPYIWEEAQDENT